MKNFSNERLLIETKEAAAKEKAATLDLLKYLHEVERRRLYACVSYSSLFSFVVGELKYSESEAITRVNAMRLMYSMNEAKEAIQSNKLSLTTASQLQRFFKQEKKTVDEKKEILKQCENLSKSKVEKILFKIAPKQFEIKESKRQVTAELTEVKFHVNDEELEKVQRVKNLKGNLSLKEIFSIALDTYLKALEKPVKKNKKVALPKNNKSQKLESSSRYYPVALKKFVRERSQNQCEYSDPITGKRCECRYRLQFEHKIPYAFGGHAIPENIMHYCQAHNQLSAIEKFGEKKMSKYF